MTNYQLPSHTSWSCFPLVLGVFSRSREGSQICSNILVHNAAAEAARISCLSFLETLLLDCVLSLSCPERNRVENVLGEKCCRGAGLVSACGDFSPKLSPACFFPGQGKGEEFRQCSSCIFKPERRSTHLPHCLRSPLHPSLSHPRSSATGKSEHGAALLHFLGQARCFGHSRQDETGH